MRLLLDTHALLWWLNGDPKLSNNAKTAIEDGANEILVSAASAWEIATKVRIGKLPNAVYVAEHLPDVIADQEFRSLPISLIHARRAGSMAGMHRDPFDRMLIAQALMTEKGSEPFLLHRPPTTPAVTLTRPGTERLRQGHRPLAEPLDRRLVACLHPAGSR